MTQPLEDVKSDTVSKKSSVGETGFMDNNKYLLIDADPMATMTTARKALPGVDAGASS